MRPEEVLTQEIFKSKELSQDYHWTDLSNAAQGGLPFNPSLMLAEDGIFLYFELPVLVSFSAVDAIPVAWYAELSWHHRSVEQPPWCDYADWDCQHKGVATHIAVLGHRCLYWSSLLTHANLRQNAASRDWLQIPAYECILVLYEDSLMQSICSNALLLQTMARFVISEFQLTMYKLQSFGSNASHPLILKLGSRMGERLL